MIILHLTYHEFYYYENEFPYHPTSNVREESTSLFKESASVQYMIGCLTFWLELVSAT